MDPQNILFNTFSTEVWQYAKILYIIAFGIYLLFSLIVVRQIKLMIATIDGKLSPTIKFFGWLNLGFACLIFLLSLILL